MNISRLAFILALLIGFPPLIQVTRSADPQSASSKRNPRPLVFVITGESNSGGIGKNADAKAKELQARSSVQIMNLTEGTFGFEDLRIGFNNLRDHYRLDKFYDDHHGLELGLANKVESGAFPGHRQVFLIKTGQGGSRIRQWAKSNPSKFLEKFDQRIEAGKKQLPENPQWIVWFSLGINDGIDGVPIEQWKKDVESHLSRISARLPNAVIVMTQFQSMGYPEINKAIAVIADAEQHILAVDSIGTSLRDKNHWDYSGLKAMADRMVIATRKLLQSSPP